MECIATLLLFFDTDKNPVDKIPVIAGAVNAVLLAFSVVVGVALERLLTKEAWKIASGYVGKSREIFYWLVLSIGITLAIRFLIGSYVHLHMTYVTPRVVTPEAWKDFWCLLKDLIFLFAFGTFLVRMAFSNTSKDFLGWILIFSCADIFWCILEIVIRYGEPGSQVAFRWLVIGVFQFVTTALSRWSLLPQQGSRNFNIFIFMAIVSLIIFGVDLWGILNVPPPWNVFPLNPC